MEDELVTEPVAPKKRGRPAGSTKASPVKRAAANASKKKDFTPQLVELTDTIAAIPTGLGLMKENDVLLADGYALKMHGRNIASAVNELAQVKPEVAQALETLGKSTPYAALAMAVLPLFAQLAANHIPKFAGMPMTHSVKDLAGAAKAEIQEQADLAAAEDY